LTGPSGGAFLHVDEAHLVGLDSGAPTSDRRRREDTDHLLQKSESDAMSVPVDE